MEYKQTAWALRTKDGKWVLEFEESDTLTIGGVYDTKREAAPPYWKKKGDRVVRVEVTMRVEEAT